MEKTNITPLNKPAYEAPAIVKEISASELERESHYAGILLPSGRPIIIP